MRRTLTTVVTVATSIFTLGALGSPVHAAPPKPKVDYRFEGNLKSSVNKDDAPRLRRQGADTQFEFGGNRDGFIKWEEGAGLKMPNGTFGIGSRGDYTIAMKVRLEQIQGFRKLVDLNNRAVDEGWYQHSGSIWPYDVKTFEEPTSPPIKEDTFHKLVVTRANGNVKGYVDGVRYFTEPDPNADTAMSPDSNVLFFFIDDLESGDEHSDGRVARLRIWKNPLTNHQANNL
jgi:Concanavalin A-like lectin/glucanases superfamily